MVVIIIDVYVCQYKLIHHICIIINIKIKKVCVE